MFVQAGWPSFLPIFDLSLLDEGSEEGFCDDLVRAKWKAFFSFTAFGIRASSKRRVGGFKKEILAADFPLWLICHVQSSPASRKLGETKLRHLASYLAVLCSVYTGQLPLYSQESEEALFAHNNLNLCLDWHLLR